MTALYPEAMVEKLWEKLTATEYKLIELECILEKTLESLQAEQAHRLASAVIHEHNSPADDTVE